MKPIYSQMGFVLALTLGIAACAPSPDSAPAPKPAPSRAPPPPALPAQPAPAHWMDAPATAGDWSYRMNGQTRAAVFGDSQSGTRFSMWCDRNNGQIALSRSGSSPSSVPMIVRSESSERTLTAAPRAETQPQLVAMLRADDPLLDAMALSKGRFAIEVGGLQTLYLPSWAEVSRVVEDCR